MILDMLLTVNIQTTWWKAKLKFEGKKTLIVLENRFILNKFPKKILKKGLYFEGLNFLLKKSYFQ